MKKYSIILVASMMATAAMAQKLTPQQEHEFFHKAYEVINTYRKAAPLSDGREEARFMDLYESSDVPIFNDLMGLNYEPTLPIKKYVRLLRDTKRQRVEIRNVRKGKVWVEDGTWLMELTFDKRISFIGLCNTFFDSHRFFEEDYHLMMVLAMEGEGSKCRIRELKNVDNEEDFRFPNPEDYKVLVKNEMDERDDKLQIGGKNGPFANFPNEGQIILRSDVSIFYNKAKVLERDLERDCNHQIMADYEDKFWRIRANGAYALSGFNKLGENGGITVTGDDEMAFGLDVGFVFPTKKRFFVGIFAGVGLSKNSLTMEFMPTGDDLSYSAPSTADEDGDAYIRKYEMLGKGITQTMNASDIAVPVYLDLEYQFQKVSIYADLGVKFQTSTGIMTATTGEYKTWGEYPDYGNLVIGKEGDVDLNGFGTHNEIGVDEEGITKKMAIDGLFGLGIRLNLNKSLALDAGMQYQTGGKSWEANKGSIFSYTLEEGDKVNLLRKVGCVRHDALKVAASIIYKF